MDLYAHSENKNYEKETVAEHVKKVARYAEENAGHFGKEYEGRIAGQFHDFGKMGERFQQVLKGVETKVNHEMAGAYVVSQRYDKTNSLEVQIAIYSHHKGLDFAMQDCYRHYFDVDFFDSYGRKMSISSPDEFVRAYQAFMAEVKDNEAQIRAPRYDCCKNSKIEQMLAIRMLFSSLVDADYTATAEHFDSDTYSNLSEIPLMPQVWLDKLMEFRENIRQKSSAHTEVNRLRDKVFENCISAAKKEPGLFTLTAPTGMGKTLALLAFALKHAQEHKKRRIFIVLPFLSIIEQNAKQYRNIHHTILEDHSQTEFDEQSRLYADRWNADVIITTSVKFFESLFRHMPTDCRRIHSIANSVIVFDEAQCLPHSLVGATLETMNALCKKYNSTVVFSSATQPAFSYRKDLDWKPVEIISDSASLFQQTRRVRVDWRIDNKTSFSDVAKQIRESSSCCAIVNMKRHSASIFRELESICKTEEDSLFHISTDMCIAHREAVLKEINHRLKNKFPCRLVSTQCIEAGVDLDFDRIFRALAPLDAIIQSAGRCNRNGRLEQGEVVVFVPEEEKYPDTSYENAANIVRLILKETDIDIYNTDHIREYYRRLYQTFGQDKKELTQAIDSLDFEGVTKAYQLIPSKGFNIIVPYKEKLDLFNEICLTARAEGLSPILMKKARPITITTYNKKIKDVGEQLFFKPVTQKHEKGWSNWFILLDHDLYNEKTGLQLEGTESLNTII